MEYYIMYLEHDTKFYEIAWTKGSIYVHYGKIPDMNTRLPFGTFKKYDFKTSNEKKSFYNKKINEKLKKGYKVLKNDSTVPTSDMKEMIKIKI